MAGFGRCLCRLTYSRTHRFASRWVSSSSAGGGSVRQMGRDSWEASRARLSQLQAPPCCERRLTFEHKVVLVPKGSGTAAAAVILVRTRDTKLGSSLFLRSSPARLSAGSCRQHSAKPLVCRFRGLCFASRGAVKAQLLEGAVLPSPAQGWLQLQRARSLSCGRHSHLSRAAWGDKDARFEVKLLLQRESF